jgi:hypothetical protein
LPSAFEDLDRGRAIHAERGEEFGKYLLEMRFLADIHSLVSLRGYLLYPLRKEPRFQGAMRELKFPQ